MSGVRISVVPQDALVDEEVEIKIEGLPPNAEVTIKASTREDGILMTSFGCYTTTERGCVSVRNQASLEGTYTGVEPMGLFWSLKWEPSYTKQNYFIKYDVTTPLIVTLSVIDGHQSWENLFDPRLKPLAITEARRWYKHKSVRMKEVRAGSTRGVLFIPPGRGPFPAVIDITGAGGGAVHYRGAMLASKGFLAFSMYFLKYDNLPRKVQDVTLDYFIESTKWFLGIPEVKKDGIGVLAFSKAGMYCLPLCRLFPQIKAVSLSNGVLFVTDYPLKYSKGDIPNVFAYMPNRIITPEGIEVIGVYQPKDHDFIKAWESSATFLFCVGEDDRTLDPALTDRFIHQIVPEQHRHRFHLIKYPDASHNIDIPFSFHHRVSSWGWAGGTCVWGGTPKGNNLAQEDFWRRTVDFFSRHLGQVNAPGTVLYKSSNL